MLASSLPIYKTTVKTIGGNNMLASSLPIYKTTVKNICGNDNGRLQ